MQFNIEENVVYPAHGVGRIIDIEKQVICGSPISVYVIEFTYENMVLRVPVGRASACGLRPLIRQEEIEKVYQILSLPARQGHKSWNQRTSSYDSKIHSGDVVLLSEVVRDLYKEELGKKPLSYSERQKYKTALHMLAMELAMILNNSIDDEMLKISEFLKTKAIVVGEDS